MKKYIKILVGALFCVLLNSEISTAQAQNCKEVVKQITNELQQLVSSQSTLGKSITERYKIKINLTNEETNISYSRKKILFLEFGKLQTNLWFYNGYCEFSHKTLKALVAHELGHLYAGHIYGKSPFGLSELQIVWEQQHEANAFAILLLGENEFKNSTSDFEFQRAFFADQTNKEWGWLYKNDPESRKILADITMESAKSVVEWYAKKAREKIKKPETLNEFIQKTYFSR